MTLFGFMVSVVPQLPFTASRCHQRDQNWNLPDYNFHKCYKLMLFFLIIPINLIHLRFLRHWVLTVESTELQKYVQKYIFPIIRWYFYLSKISNARLLLVLMMWILVLPPLGETQASFVTLGGRTLVLTFAYFLFPRWSRTWSYCISNFWPTVWYSRPPPWCHGNQTRQTKRDPVRIMTRRARENEWPDAENKLTFDTISLCLCLSLRL